MQDGSKTNGFLIDCEEEEKQKKEASICFETKQRKTNINVQLSKICHCLL
jgi:hypothetical protein